MSNTFTKGVTLQCLENKSLRRAGVRETNGNASLLVWYASVACFGSLVILDKRAQDQLSHLCHVHTLGAGIRPTDYSSEGSSKFKRHNC